ncbi:hypothetical protein ACP4OV_009535 [Aristida adscensionis]
MARRRRPTLSAAAAARLVAVAALLLLLTAAHSAAGARALMTPMARRSSAAVARGGGGLVVAFDAGAVRCKNQGRKNGKAGAAASAPAWPCAALPGDAGVDGADERVVPTGANPLHNR